MHCFRTFRIASECIRHAEDSHKGETGRKATYMRATYDEIRRRVDSELALAKAAHLSASIESRSRKRARDVAGTDPVIPGAKRIMGVDVHINGTKPSTQLPNLF